MTYEEQKQLLIVRQSQMERALEYYQLLGVKPTSLELILTAELFTESILAGTNLYLKALTKQVKERAEGMDKYLETKIERDK